MMGVGPLSSPIMGRGKLGRLMKAFFVGLIFLIAVIFLSGIGFLFFPLILVLGLLFRFIISIVFVLLCIWLLGRFIIFIWEAIAKK